jgi:2-polyprenyl-3-methyl-5-hydroxy-6-metoxy-1,4-benzoquinol methylase
MDIFEHQLDTPIISGNSQNWLNEIDQHYLNSLTEKDTVLEIASGHGEISKLICEKNVSKLVMVDPFSIDHKLKNTELINQDVFFWLPTSTNFDVVICFGLIYHIHDGLRLLEMIVNYCNPKKIILDSVVAPHPLAFNPEEFNVPGSRQIPNTWKASPFNLNVPFHIINRSLDFMGYTLTKTHLIKCDFFQKSNSWVAEWQSK